MSFDIILPFLRPIAHLITDPGISEIMIHGGERVFVERDGVVSLVAGLVLDTRSLTAAAKHIARACHDDVSEEKPLLDARLPDGSRVAVALPPCSVGGVTMTVRKFGTRQFTLAELVTVGMLAPTMHEALLAAIARRDTLLISGGTSAGKTTCLNAIARELPIGDRIIVIEETAEIVITHANVVRFEARRQQDTLPAVTIRDLLRASLRHRPDRLVVGEVRGAEAFDLLQCLNTGHNGSMSTIHANSARLAVHRLVSCVLQAGEHLPHEAICAQVADTIHLVLHLDRRHGQRLAQELVRVRRYDFTNHAFEFETVCGTVTEGASS